MSFIKTTPYKYWHQLTSVKLNLYFLPLRLFRRNKSFHLPDCVIPQVPSTIFVSHLNNAYQQAYIFAHLFVGNPKSDALSAPGIVSPLSTSSFNALSILNSILPFEPESTHSTDVSPSKILSATIPVNENHHHDMMRHNTCISKMNITSDTYKIIYINT